MKQFNPRALSLAVALLISGWAAAQNTALTSGAWETGANWSSGAAPVATDAVVIPAGLSMTVNAAGDLCASLTIASGGTVTVNNGDGLAIGGFLSNAGTLTAVAGSTLTFNGTANSTITGGGAYTIAGTVVLDMGSAATYLDVQDADFITGINTGAKYYFTFTQGTFRMDNAGTLNNCYNSGSSSALTIPFGVVIESDNGTMNLCKNAPSGSALLSGQLFLNGGTVTVQTGQSLNSGQDFKYKVNGGTPQLYVSSGTLYVGAGFNANTMASDYIDFHQTGGTIVVAEDGYSKSYTFQLANNVGGKTFMSGGTIILQDACNANVYDIDMGGANVAATLYSVTGGTVQLGYSATQSSSTFFGVNPEPTTNYPNIDFQSGTAKSVAAATNGVVNMLSLYINPNMTYDATGFSTTNILSNNGTFAFDDEGTFTTGNNTVTFSGAVPQLIASSALTNVNFYNLKISNTSGNVQLGVNTTVTNQFSFTSGLLDASKKTLTISNGSVAVTGASATSYVITGNGFASFGNMNVDALPTNTATLFPIGTASYYLPAYVNPGANTGTTYSAYVFTGATTNAKANGAAFSAALLANMLNTIWNISQTAGAGSATLNLDWTPAETALEGSTFKTAGTGIGIMQYMGAAGWTVPTGTGNVATATSSSSFSSFTQFAVVDNLVVLPVVVSDFNTILNNNNTVLLSWSASDEVDISDFEVQRSTDGSNYSTIGTVQANATESGYSLIDPHPAPGVNYYRLLIQQTDGSGSYSNIRTVDLSSTAAIGIYPNPTANKINVSVSNATPDLSIRLVSLTGQVLQSITPGATGASVTTIDVSQYPAAIYLVQLVNSQKVIQVSSVIVTH